MPPLSEHEIHIWSAHIPSSPTLLRRYAGFLSAEERQRAQRFRFSRDRNRYQFMHGMLREILGNYLSVAPTEIIMSRNSFGKPQINKSPGNHAIGFNISHSHGFVVAACSHGRNVGVDVEYLNPQLPVEDIIPSLFSPDEAASFRDVADRDRSKYVLRLWTMKEAYVKAMGTGMHEPFKNITFSFDSDGVPALVDAVNDHDLSRWTVTQLRFGDNYLGALVFDSPGARIRKMAWVPDHAGSVVWRDDL